MRGRFARAAALVLALAAWLGCAAALAADGLPWFDGARPAPQAQQAVELLGAAASHGLEPQDYDAAALRAAPSRGAHAGPGAGPGRDRAAGAGADRGDGALPVGPARRPRRPAADPPRLHAAAPRRVRRRGRAARGARAAAPARGRARAAPRLPLYERLREALARYRELADHPAWQQPLPPLPGDSRRQRSASWSRASPTPAWRCWRSAWLALGDLAPDAPLPARYEGPLVDAVQAFQQRHGLAADGVIGAATLAQLQVAPAARVRQIELTLERLRWTPLMQGPRMIVINIPEFVLRAYEVHDGRISVRRGDEGHRRQGAGHAHAAVRRGHALHRVQPLLERAAVDRARRDRAAAAARPGLLRARGLRVRRPRTAAWTARCRRPSSTPCSPARLRIRQRPGPQQRARRHQVRVPEPRPHLPAPHAGDAAVRARPARLQPRLHPRRAAGGAGDVRAAGHAGVDRGAHPPGDGARRIDHAAAGRAGAGADRLRNHARQRRSNLLLRRHLRPSTACSTPRCASARWSRAQSTDRS